LNDRGPRGLLPVGLLAVAAVIYSLVPGGTAPPGPVARTLPNQAPGKETSPPPTAETGPLKLLFDYLDMRSGGTAPIPRPKGEMKKDCPDEDLHPVRFLIATVPDPIDSHLAPSFDRAVDAIQTGLQEKGYILDRFYLPWKRDAEARWNVLRLPPGAPEGLFTVNAKPMPSDTHRRVPGTLLFRESQPSRPGIAEGLVVVFLVGETPTSGVQREAMTSALDAIVSCPEKDPPCISSCESDRIHILGPYFSGSTDSLRHLLRAWSRSNQKPVEIVSGSATVGQNVGELTFDRVRFQATVIPDAALTEVFFDFLKRQLGADTSKDVALFAEGGTTYGVGDFKSWFPHITNFPLHVSQLRAAYEKDDALRNPSRGGRAPRHALELALEAPEGTTRDILPAQDARMAANIADLALSNGVETIRREGIRFVGIAASDPRDVLFIARKIRENAANVTLFTFGADSLYTHPDYEQYLRGMLVITPYPLFPANQDWTGFGVTRKAFSGSNEEGIYNAVLHLLRDSGKPAPLLEYRVPFEPEKKKPAASRPGEKEPAPSGTDEPEPSNRPPIWITAVGRHGFWPVGIIPKYDDKTDGKPYVLSVVSAASRTKGPGEYRPAGAILTFVLIELLFLGVVALYVGMRRTDAPSAPAATESSEAGETSRRRRNSVPPGLRDTADTVLSVWSAASPRQINRVYVATLLLILAFVQATLVVAVSRVMGLLKAGIWLFAPALVLLVCLVSLAVRECVFLFRSPHENERGKTSARHHALAPAIFLAGLGVFFALYWSEIFSMTPLDLVPFYARVFDLTSTISPVLPLLLSLAVLALWAVCNTRRAFLLEVQGEEYPGTEKLKTFSGLQELQGAIQNLLADPASRAILLLAPIVAFVPFYRVVSLPFDSMDGQRWSLLFKFCLLACYFVIVYGVTLFIALWLRVRLLLRRLSWHPVAEAFKRLPESVAASPWRMWRAVPSLTGLEASVSQLWTLVNLGKSCLEKDYWAALKAEAETAQILLDKAFNETSRSFVESLPTQRKLRRLLASVMVRLLEPLEDVWRRWPGAADAQKELRRAGAQEQFFSVPDWLRRDVPGGSAVWIRAAEEFIALRLSSYVRYVFLQIKNLLTFAFLEFLCVIAAINSYPFEPRHPVMALVWVVALICLALVAWAFVGMERDRVLSYIGKTKPGEVTLSLEFASSMTIYVVIPLLTLLATQFPGLGDVIFSVFTPAMKSVR